MGNVFSLSWLFAKLTTLEIAIRQTISAVCDQDNLVLDIALSVALYSAYYHFTAETPEESDIYKALHEGENKENNKRPVSSRFRA